VSSANLSSQLITPQSKSLTKNEKLDYCFDGAIQISRDYTRRCSVTAAAAAGVEFGST